MLNYMEKLNLVVQGVSTAVFDGGAQAMFSEFKLETKDNTAIEYLKRNNRVMQSLKLNCSGVVNLKNLKAGTIIFIKMKTEQVGLRKFQFKELEQIKL